MIRLYSFIKYKPLNKQSMSNQHRHFRKLPDGILAGLVLLLMLLTFEKGFAQGIKSKDTSKAIKPLAVNSESNNALPINNENQLIPPASTNTEERGVSKIISGSKTLQVKKSQASLRTNPEQSNEPAKTNYAPDTTLSAAYIKSTAAYYYALERENLKVANNADLYAAHQHWALENRREVLLRQQFTGSLIFVLVVVVVLSGLIFSAMQFRIALKTAGKKGIVAPDTSLKASLSGVEVSSSILGVIVLALSIIFFYLYLKTVFPIVSIDNVP
jgi:hypothetical protein